jgi:hypothetical protein
VCFYIGSVAEPLGQHSQGFRQVSREIEPVSAITITEIGNRRPETGAPATREEFKRLIKNADRAAVGRYRCDVVLGVARLRTDQHAQS